MNTKLIAPLAVVGTLVVVAISCNLLGIQGLLVAPAVFAAVILASKPKVVLLLFWLLTLFTPTIEILIPDVYVKVMEQGAALYLLVILLATYIIDRKPIRGSRPLQFLVLPLLVVMAASTLANRVPPKAVLFYVLVYMKHFWVFLYALRFLGAEDARSVFRVMMLSFLLQVVFNVAFYLGVNPLPQMYRRGFEDASLGTLGSSHYVGYYMTAFLFIAIARFGLLKSFKGKLACASGAAVALLQFFYSYTMHAYPLLAAGLGLQYVAYGRGLARKALRLVPALILVTLVIAALVAFGPAGGETTKYLRKEVWVLRWERMLTGYKGQAYEAVFLHGDRYLAYPWLGGGPGNYTSSTARLLGRPLSMLPHLAYLTYATDPQARIALATGSVVFGTGSGMIALWGEVGPLGFLLYWGFYAYAAFRVWRLARRHAYRDSYRQTLAEAFVPTTIVFVAVNCLFDAIALLHLTLGFWIWAAAVWNADSAETEAEQA